MQRNFDSQILIIVSISILRSSGGTIIRTVSVATNIIAGAGAIGLFIANIIAIHLGVWG